MNVIEGKFENMNKTKHYPDSLTDLSIDGK